MDDGDHYMDDLFGDGDADPIPMPAPAPAVKGLPQRLDELASSSCTRKISWSRFGVIAAVDETGYGVNLYTYARDVKSRGWKLSKPMPLWPEVNNSNKNNNNDNNNSSSSSSKNNERQIVHIEWSNMGNALVIVDSFGRTMIYVPGYALNQMSPARLNQSASDDELHAMVGLYWFPVFPQQQKPGTYWSARWDGEDFEYVASHHAASGAYNPVDGKSALLCLNKSNTLRLLYEQRDGRWSEASAEVDQPTAHPDYSVTHAAFGPNTDDSVLLATYDIFQCLRLFQVKIRWNKPADFKENPAAQLRPIIEISALLHQKSCLPISQPSANAAPQDTLESSPRVHLSQLEIIPVAPDNRTHDPTYPTVMAIFTLLPPSASVQLLDISQQYQHASAVVCRWQIRVGAIKTLSPCFDQLTQKKRSVSAARPRQAIRLDRAPDTLLHYPVMATAHLRHSTLLSFAMSDGSIHFKDRESMEELSLDTDVLNAQTRANIPEIKNMAQVGFSFPLIESPLHIALSPNYCMVAVYGKGGQLQLKKMEYTMLPLRELTVDDPKFHSVVVALALQHGTAILSYKSSDDLLAMLPDGNEDLKLGFVQQCRRTTRINYDIYIFKQEAAKPITILNKLQSLYRCVSVQNTLGINSSGGRSLRAKLAWMTLNLRFSCLILVNTLKTDENLRPDVANSLHGQLHWSLDFFIYLSQELFDFCYRVKGREGDHAFLSQTLQSENSPALLVVLSSLTRVLLLMLLGPIQHGIVHAQNGSKMATTPEQRAPFEKMKQLYRTPRHLGAFRDFLMEVEGLVKDAYAAGAMTDAARTRIENAMFQRAELPVELMPAVRTALTDRLPKLMRVSDPGTVRNYDIAWLGFTDDPRSRAVRDRIAIDVIRKLPLHKGVRLRRCLRCTSVMEDIQPHGPGWQSYQPWVVTGQKSCICYSSWAILDGWS